MTSIVAQHSSGCHRQQCRASLRLPLSHPPAAGITRRNAHADLLFLIPLTTSWVWAPPASASLIQFPVNQLNNRYVLVRAGESEAESNGRVLTNPVSKTSMSNALSTKGKRQVVQETYPALQDLCGEGGLGWLWPSMQTNSYQSAEILAALFGVGRNRIVPEFSKLDARGVGALEGGQLETVAHCLLSDFVGVM